MGFEILRGHFTGIASFPGCSADYRIFAGRAGVSSVIEFQTPGEILSRFTT